MILQDGSERRAIIVRGVVQGVGFRPFVFRLATALDLGGFVRNHADSVQIEIEGRRSKLLSFLDQLETSLPRHASIEAIDVAGVRPRGDRCFLIEPSKAATHLAERFFSADIATCDVCVAELFDPNDRRYLYPFTSCAHCGPRLTIIRSAPYDRARTTMAAFEMCGACRVEYEDPNDRRFHAQPIACSSCGPKLSARDATGQLLDVEPLAFFEALIAKQEIVAIKGLGGYQLACDAESRIAVEALRAGKQREEKPFAVLVADLAIARRLCQVSDEEAALLSSPERPIVLLRSKTQAIAGAVAPNNPHLGLMLPYTPLHHLLARAAKRPLVLTSGNRSDEPIIFEDAAARMQLGDIATGFLTHDREIHLRCDDSVARVIDHQPVVLRRARGYAPQPIHLPFTCPSSILALGGQLKNTFALGRGDHAFVSHHLGDLGDWITFRAFRETLAHYQTLFAFEPAVLVHDLHPGYATSEYARSQALRLIAVQHHHAHLASCMVENELKNPVIGVIFDGSGFGGDGTLWGGEFLIGDRRSFRRAAHLRAVPLPGGERAIREPWRMALVQLIDAGVEPEEFLSGVEPEALRVVRRMIERRINTPLTSSAGRLFDAIASLLGLRDQVTFEGQAAMELESLAYNADQSGSYPFEIDQNSIDTRPLIKACIEALERGEPKAQIARRFHDTLAAIITQVSARLRDETGIHEVVLSGGVFQNQLLLETTKRSLRGFGLHVHTQARVPSNDGGLSLGQLAVAAAILEGDA